MLTTSSNFYIFNFENLPDASFRNGSAPISPPFGAFCRIISMDKASCYGVNTKRQGPSVSQTCPDAPHEKFLSGSVRAEDKTGKSYKHALTAKFALTFKRPNCLAKSRRRSALCRIANPSAFSRSGLNPGDQPSWHVAFNGRSDLVFNPLFESGNQQREYPDGSDPTNQENHDKENHVDQCITTGRKPDCDT